MIVRCAVGGLLLIGSTIAAAGPVLAAQGRSGPESFFWAGVLTAFVPVLVFGALSAVLVRIYLRDRRDENERAGEGAG